MPRKCTVCVSLERETAEKLHLEGMSLWEISKQTGLSKQALHRHFANGHMSKKLQKSEQAQEVINADSLVKELSRYKAEVQSIFDMARQEGKSAIALSAVDRLVKLVETMGKLLGQFAETQVNVNVLMQGSEISIFMQQNHPRVWGELVNHLRDKYYEGR